MSKRDARTPEQQEFDERVRRIEAIEERRNHSLTRGEVLDAIEQVASDYDRYYENGEPDANMIARAFRTLGKALS